jgi:hypothetical protein
MYNSHSSCYFILKNLLHKKGFFLEFEIRFKVVSLQKYRPCNSLLQRMRVISTTILETNKNVLVPLQTGESELIPRAKENNPTLTCNVSLKNTRGNIHKWCPILLGHF